MSTHCGQTLKNLLHKLYSTKMPIYPNRIFTRPLFWQCQGLWTMPTCLFIIKDKFAYRMLKKGTRVQCKQWKHKWWYNSAKSSYLSNCQCKIIYLGIIIYFHHKIFHQISLPRNYTCIIATTPLIWQAWVNAKNRKMISVSMFISHTP